MRPEARSFPGQPGNDVPQERRHRPRSRPEDQGSERCAAHADAGPHRQRAGEESRGVVLSGPLLPDGDRRPGRRFGLSQGSGAEAHVRRRYHDMAALGSAYMQQNQRDSAFAIFRQIIARGDSIGYYQLYKVGAEISSSVPEDPDTTKESASCRTAARSVRPALTMARIRARCDSVARDVARNFKKNSDEAFSLSVQALDASLKRNPYNREALIFRANTALGQHDSAPALTISRRLIHVDPMSRVGLKIMASAQAQNHNIDSALYYFKLSDSTLVGDVAVTQ